MKRTISALLMLLLLLPALPPAAAAGAGEHWDTGRVLRADVTIPALVDLQVGPGVNISFEPDLNASDFAPVYLNLSGGLEVCATAGRPSAFRASNESLFLQGDIAGRLTIQGNGDPGQADVRNCSFVNLVLIIIETAGRFQDCSFDSCYLYVQDSGVLFENSTFLRSAMSIYSILTLNETRLSRCTFDSLNKYQYDPFWRTFSSMSAVSVSGYAAIDNCTVAGYGTGIESSSGLPAIADCLVKDCGYGMELMTTDPADTPRIERCVIQNCTQAALSVDGNLILRNCTLSGSPTGLELSSNVHGIPPGWTLSGNRIFGNLGYGVHLAGEDFELGDTVFDDGAGRTNVLGRVLKQNDLFVNVTTRGTAELLNLTMNLTDSFGELFNAFPMGHLNYFFSRLTEYVVDNSGERRNGYPYTLRAAWNGIFCATTIPDAVSYFRLYLPVLPDLVPLAVAIDPPAPKAGQWVVISCAVRNAGPSPSPRASALFTLDGERLDQSDMFPVGAWSNSTVISQDWKARRGTHTVTVRLDPLNALEENDESNNNLTFNFTVGEAPPKPPGAVSAAYLGGAAAVVLALAGAGAFLVLRRRRRGGGA
jgi:hypothetical protein